MTPEFQEQIFDTFTRERKSQVDRTEGTGLGMAITKAIVDAMNGTIELHSEPEKGSEFHITLDLERAKAKEEEMVKNHHERQDDYKVVLLAEDNDLNWEIAEDLLSEVGFKLERAATVRSVSINLNSPRRGTTTLS